MNCRPPVLPPGSVYTSCWCEENVYLLCQNFLANPEVTKSWEVFTVFISNQNRSVALWFQKAACGEGDPVIWDYHVILVLHPRNQGNARLGSPTFSQSWVYDFDTCLSLPCEWKEYCCMSLPEGILPPYESQFRVISGEEFLQHFASDRSHMVRVNNNVCTKLEELMVYAQIIKSNGEDVLYSSPPPPYAPICGPSSSKNGIKNNLMQDYVCMTQNEAAGQEIYGVVMNRTEAEDFFF